MKYIVENLAHSYGPFESKQAARDWAAATFQEQYYIVKLHDPADGRYKSPTTTISRFENSYKPDVDIFNNLTNRYKELAKQQADRPPVKYNNPHPIIDWSNYNTYNKNN